MHYGLSESARVTSAAEARFRIDYPNSRPRRSLVVALNAASLPVLDQLRSQSWNGAQFLRFVGSRPIGAPLPGLTVDAALADDTGNEVSLLAELANAEMVVMLTGADSDTESARLVGGACLVSGKTTIGIILESDRKKDLAAALATMRPFSAMLVVASGSDYIGDMLTALRA
jgi:hypothetical protein